VRMFLESVLLVCLRKEVEKERQFKRVEKREIGKEGKREEEGSDEGKKD
jgi:hypothetical protein